MSKGALEIGGGFILVIGIVMAAASGEGSGGMVLGAILAALGLVLHLVGRGMSGAT